MSKCEQGHCPLDVMQLRVFCQALGATLPALITKLERRLVAKKKQRITLSIKGCWFAAMPRSSGSKHPAGTCQGSRQRTTSACT